MVAVRKHSQRGIKAANTAKDRLAERKSRGAPWTRAKPCPTPRCVNLGRMCGDGRCWTCHAADYERAGGRL